MMQASVKFVEWAGRRRRGVAITGASGWIGRAVAHAALSAPGLEPLRLFGSRAGTVRVAGRTLPLEPLEQAAPLDPAVEWIVVHLAVSGADREPDPAVRRALNDALLQRAFALSRGAPVRRLVSASSGAVHQQGASPEARAYARLKRDQETAARHFAADAGMPLLIPRIFNVGGPYMNHADRYALGSFVRQATQTAVIRIQANRPVLRSYVHVLELAHATLHLALDDEPELTVETAGTEVVEMADLARAVGAALGLPLSIERPPLTADAEDRYLGDGARYRAALAEMGRAPAGLDRIVRDTAAWLEKEAAG